MERWRGDRVCQKPAFLSWITADEADDVHRIRHANLAIGGNLVRPIQHTLTLVAAMIALSTIGLTAPAAQSAVQLGPRPFYLVVDHTDYKG
jgi:hypothetical protein